eukprot:gene6848-1488_t
MNSSAEATDSSAGATDSSAEATDSSAGAAGAPAPSKRRTTPECMALSQNGRQCNAELGCAWHPDKDTCGDCVGIPADACRAARGCGLGKLQGDDYCRACGGRARDGGMDGAPALCDETQGCTHDGA